MYYKIKIMGSSKVQEGLTFLDFVTNLAKYVNQGYEIFCTVGADEVVLRDKTNY